MDELYPQPDTADIELLEVLKAVGDPVRLQMLSVIADGETQSCSPEVFGLDVHKSTLSHHLRVLREAGVTSTRVVDGRKRGVELRRSDLDERFPGLVDGLLSGVRGTAR
jgi:DNA-binding transcriptional ArsR family regulator